jgi:hypothetical protein
LKFLLRGNGAPGGNVDVEVMLTVAHFLLLSNKIAYKPLNAAPLMTFIISARAGQNTD